eukprot:3871176-Prymnesium_polylepis.1
MRTSRRATSDRTREPTRTRNPKPATRSPQPEPEPRPYAPPHACATRAHVACRSLTALRPVVTKHTAKEHVMATLPGMQLSRDVSATDADGVRLQLREAMGRMALSRVIDVFRAWDTDDNGVISRR